MSILIKGAEMPKNCWECLGNDLCVAIAEMGGACPFTEQIIGRDMFDAHSGIHPDCPLVEIPPHGRLIDADKLDRHFIYASDDNIAGMGYVDSEQEIYNEAIDDARLTVQDAPTVIESEEQEHE